MTATHEKIVKAVKYTAFAKKDAANAEHVNFYLGFGEKLTQEQLDDFHAAAARLVVGQPEAAAEPEIEPWLVPEPEAVAEPEAEPWLAEPEAAPAPEAVPLAAAEEFAPAEPEAPAPEAAAEPDYDPEAVRDRAIAADRALAEARLTLARAKDALAASNAKLAATVTAFQVATGTKRPTQAEFFKQHAAEQNEIRRKIAAGELPPPQRRGAAIGRSAVDRAAFYARGGNPAGGGGAYRRGAFPSSAHGAPNYDPRRGPVAKLPSQK